jgi:hypothetical protein
LANSDSQYISVPELAVVNGKSELIKFLKLTGDSEELLGKGGNEVARLHELNKLLPDLEQLSMTSIRQQAERMHDESDGLDIAAAYEFRQNIQLKMMNENTKEEGYIIWLDLAKRKVKQASLLFASLLFIITLHMLNRMLRCLLFLKYCHTHTIRKKVFYVWTNLCKLSAMRMISRMKIVKL